MRPTTLSAKTHQQPHHHHSTSPSSSSARARKPWRTAHRLGRPSRRRLCSRSSGTQGFSGLDGGGEEVQIAGDCSRLVRG
ncbi:hypothetical protein KC363_g66 [Hortaea werneckii]|nr:hypothetical protein KC363_g66 [Hortaea werneckii]